MQLYALSGFGYRAQAVKVDPTEIFKTTTQKKKLPNLHDLIDCETADEIKAVECKDNGEKVDCYAILPPFLTEILFDDDDYSPMNVLLKMLKKSRSLIKTKIETIEITSDQGSTTEMETEEKTSPKVDEEMTPAYPRQVELDDLEDKTTLPHPLQDYFGGIFDFLYIAATNPNAVKTNSVGMCLKETSTMWTEKQHEDLLARRHHLAAPQSAPATNPDVLDKMSDKFGFLADAIAAREQFEPQKKREKQELVSGAKKFEKLSPIIKNTLLMFTIIPGMTQDDISEVEPTENALSLLEVNSGSVIRQLLHNYMRQKGCMVHLQLGMCNSLKILIIAFSQMYSLALSYVFSIADPRK